MPTCLRRVVVPGAGSPMLIESCNIESNHPKVFTCMPKQPNLEQKYKLKTAGITDWLKVLAIEAMFDYILKTILIHLQETTPPPPQTKINKSIFRNFSCIVSLSHLKRETLPTENQ